MILSEEQAMIRDMVREFARDKVLPGAEARSKNRTFPKDALDQMAELGLLGMLAPEEFNGSGSGYVSFVLAMEEIAAADGALSTIMSVHSSPCTTALLYYGTDALRNDKMKEIDKMMMWLNVIKNNFEQEINMNSYLKTFGAATLGVGLGIFGTAAYLHDDNPVDEKVDEQRNAAGELTSYYYECSNGLLFGSIEMDEFDESVDNIDFSWRNNAAITLKDGLTPVYFDRRSRGDFLENPDLFRAVVANFCRTGDFLDRRGKFSSNQSRRMVDLAP